MSKRLFLILAGALITALSSLAPADAQSYPMSCMIRTMDEAVVVPLAGMARVAFSTSRGPIAAGLQPVQCAFADRAVRAGEPNRLCFAASINEIIFNGSTATRASFGGPGLAVLQSAVFGPTKLVNVTVHLGDVGSLGGPCFLVDAYGV
jgi:hypothetical protein